MQSFAMLTQNIICVFACIVLAQSLPTGQLENENIAEKHTTVTLEKEDVKSSTENLKETENTNTDKITDLNNDDKNKNPEKVADVNKDDKKEDIPTKLNIKDDPSIDTIVTVYNNRIGIDKKYYFKDIYRVEGGERYKCKVGYSSGGVIFYFRCLLVSSGIMGEGIEEKAPFLF